MGQYDLPYTGPQVEALLAKISELESEMPSKTSDLTNDSGFITSEDVPTKTSDLNNDSGFITNAPVAAEAARAQAAEALLATISSLQAEITRATGVEGTLQDLIDGIAAKIPSAATAQNQLADKDFVNSSIATASATFRGTYISLVALQAVAADENDYGYVISTDAVGNTIYNRYKYANSTWIFEYAIANPIFDSSQWAAINSAITAELVEKLRALPTNAALTELLNGKQGVIADLDTIRANAAKCGTAYQKPAGGIPKTDLESGVQTSLGKADSAVQESAIADNLTTDDAKKVLSAKQGVVLAGQISQLGQEVHGFKYEDAFNITTTGDHSSNNDRITFPSVIPAGEYTFKVESGTTGNSGSAIFYVKYVGASTTTSIGGGALGIVITAELTAPIESIGIYMSAATNQHTGSMPLTIESTADNIVKDIQQLQDDVAAAEQNIESDKKYVLNNRFIGAGSAFSSIKLYGLKAGIKYRIELQNPSLLTDTTSDTTAKKFVVNYLKSDSTRGVLVYKNIGDGSVSGYYEFTMPNDIAENGDIEVGGRAVAGKVINFSIYAVQTLDYITYGVVRCTTAGATANKEVTIPGFAAANNERVRFIIYMGNPTTTWAKLVVNGGNPVNLYYNGAQAGAANTWSAAEYLDVIYNSSYPAFFATTRTNLSQSVNQDSPNKQKVISEAGIVDFVEGDVDKNVRFYNTDKESAIVSAASRSPLVYEKTNNGLCPVFSVLTDLHSDLDRFKRACAYADTVSDVLATLCLGDLINHSNAQNPYPLILNYTKPVISITGNHEVLKSGAITGWSESDIISNMYNPDQVTHNGETHPTDKCYWYKDFSKTIDGATKKLRVIGLHQYEGSGTGEQNTGSGKDVCFYTQDQIDWLIARLDEVDSNTWVMLLIHYAPTANMTRIECPFTPSSSFNFPLQGGSNTGGASSMSDDEFIPKIIQAWIDGTTLDISCDITVGEDVTHITAVKATAFSAHAQKFAGYFCGHTHRDFVGKLTNYPKQLQFAFITTSAATAQQSCDIGRKTSGKTQDCFTLVGVDWFKNSVNLVRIGADTTTDMRERKYANIPIPTNP